MSFLEKSYNLIFKNLKRAINPVKKRIMKTECKVHKFINNQALVILKNDGHEDAFDYLNQYIEYINAGVVWADQDLKSSNHFYNPHTLKGLYGNSNAKKECMAYYRKAINEYFHCDIQRAMFYLGAACHLIQDMTVPQHVNIHLLHNHRNYEKWVVRMHKHHDEFKTDRRGIYLKSVKYYIELNSKKAIETYKKYSVLKDRELRYHKITSNILVLAQRTTTGLMYKFYNDINKMEKVVHCSGRTRPIGYWHTKLAMAVTD